MAVCTVATAGFPTNAPMLKTMPVRPCWLRSPATYLNLPMSATEPVLDAEAVPQEVERLPPGVADPRLGLVQGQTNPLQDLLGFGEGFGSR